MRLEKFLQILTEESKTKYELSAIISHSSEQIIKHIFKLYFYGKENNTNIAHWKKEIYNFLNAVNKLKGKNKLPNYKLVYQSSWLCYEDEFDRFSKIFIRNLNTNYSESYGLIECSDKDKQKLYNICKQYFSWLSLELSKNGYVEQEEVINKLNEILR